jgi:outer membrane usher protein
VVGDFSANTGQLGGGGSFAGLSLSRNLGLDPYLVTFPGLNVTGVLETPSDVDIYVNDQLVDSTHLAPGPFDLQNIAANAGSGDVRLVIRDAFGRESVITTPFYQVSNLLRPGLHDYSYNIGVKRRHLGLSNFSYAEPTALAFHNYGVTSWLTLGLRGEVDQRTVNGGPILALALGQFGQISATGAIGRRGIKQGVAGSFNYSYSGTPVTFGTSLTAYSKDYVNISSPDQPLVSRRLLASGSLGVNLSSFGSISGSFVYADAYNNRPSKRFSLTYSRPLFQNTSLQIRGSATKTDKWSRSLFVGINFSLGHSGSGSIQHSQQDNQSSQNLDFTHSAPRGTGFGGQAHLERIRTRSGKTDHNGDLFAQYNGSYGIYTTSVRQSARKNSYSFGVTGSLAWIDHGIYFSRPINDAFALVKVKGLKNVTVLNSNSKVGKTDSNGNILIPDIISYYGNDISIDPQDIPINYDISSASRQVAAPLRGGAVIDFDVRKLQAFVGNFHYLSEGKTSVAKYWGLELMINGQPKQFILGDTGGFYLENIASGEYKARIFDKHHECRFVMAIPDSEEMMVDMGNLSCEIH